MNNNSDTKRLADAVTALAATLTEIMAEKLRAIAEIQEQKIAHKTIEPLMSRQQLAEHFGVSQRTIETWIGEGLLAVLQAGPEGLVQADRRTAPLGCGTPARGEVAVLNRGPGGKRKRGFRTRCPRLGLEAQASEGGGAGVAVLGGSLEGERREVPL
jgi:hypothetical protein